MEQHYAMRRVLVTYVCDRVQDCPNGEMFHVEATAHVTGLENLHKCSVCGVTQHLKSRRPYPYEKWERIL